MPHEFGALDGETRSTAFPGIVKVNGTNIPVAGYAFDASAVESLFFRFRASAYTGGNFTVDLDWYPDTATSNVVVWGCQIAALTPGDAQDIETDALAAQNTANGTATGAQRLVRTTVTVSNLDSLAADDQVVLCVQRVATSGSDTLTGDAILTYVSIAA